MMLSTASSDTYTTSKSVQLLKQRVTYRHPENVEKVFEEYSLKFDMIYGHP